MAVKPNSLAAYEKISANLSHNRGKVFSAIYSSPEPVCDYQIAMLLGWQHHCITPRRGELEKMGFIQVAFNAPGPPYNMDVAYWQICPDCLIEGWKPKSTTKKPCRRHRTVSVHEASMILVEHRRRLRAQRRKEVYPLFGRVI